MSGEILVIIVVALVVAVAAEWDVYHSRGNREKPPEDIQ